MGESEHQVEAMLLQICCADVLLSKDVSARIYQPADL